LEPVLQRLRYDHHEVVLFHLMHHDELTFELGGMVKFVGLEDHEVLLGQTDDLRESYLDAVREHGQQLDAIVERYGCERVLVDTSESPRDQLIDYLNKRSLMGRSR